MEKRYLKLNDIDAYRRSFHLSNQVWELVILWDQFSKNTVGTQFVRAVDSISANLAEGSDIYSEIFKELNALPLEINQLIKYTDLTLKK